jgi:hypothetical protein
MRSRANINCAIHDLQLQPAAWHTMADHSVFGSDSEDAREVLSESTALGKGVGSGKGFRSGKSGGIKKVDKSKKKAEMKAKKKAEKKDAKEKRRLAKAEKKSAKKEKKAKKDTMSTLRSLTNVLENKNETPLGTSGGNAKIKQLKRMKATLGFLEDCCSNLFVVH